MITVWGRRNSVNVQKVMWALGETETAYKRVDVGGSFGVTDEYLALNSKGTVPTIVDPDVGLSLWESNACVRYIATNYGQGSLQPTDVKTVALADQWMDFQNTVLSPAFFQIFLNKIRLPADKAQPNQIAAGIKRCNQIFSDLDMHLTGKSYITGEAFNLGDISIGAHLYRYYTMDIDRPFLPNVEAWYARLCQRSAYQKHVMIPFGTNNAEWDIEEKKNADIQ